MDAYTCPKGHSSTESDFCSECGARIQGTAAAPADAATGIKAQSGGRKCPDCGASQAADGGNFCEICGYNFATGAHGEVPVATPASQPPVAPPAGWTIVAMVDLSLKEAGSPDPPAGAGPFTMPLDKPVNLIGRRSESHAIFPEIPLDFDDAVSHRHALIEKRDDGSLVLRDIGSANGTRLNGKDCEPMVDIALQDGDELTMGHWTRITVKAVH